MTAPALTEAGVMIRDLHVGDIDAIVEIERVVQPWTPWSADAFHEAHERPETYACRVATVVDAEAPVVAGYAVLAIAGPDGDREADLQNIAVAPERQRRGLGRALLADAVAAARRRHACEIFLDVRADNGPAHALYRAAGFAEIGRRRDYYAPGQDALVLRLDLRSIRGTGPHDG